MKDTEYLVLAKPNSSDTCKTYQYLRSSSTEMIKLEDCLKLKHKCDSCIITNSGTIAIYTIINGIFIFEKFAKFNIMLSNQTFYKTQKQLNIIVTHMHKIH